MSLEEFALRLAERACELHKRGPSVASLLQKNVFLRDACPVFGVRFHEYWCGEWARWVDPLDAPLTDALADALNDPESPLIAPVRKILDSGGVPRSLLYVSAMELVCLATEASPELREKITFLGCRARLLVEFHTVLEQQKRDFLDKALESELRPLLTPQLRKRCSEIRENAENKKQKH